MLAVRCCTALALVLALTVLGGCGRVEGAAAGANPAADTNAAAGANPTADTKTPAVATSAGARDKSEDQNTVALEPEMVKRLGITTVAAQAVTYTPHVEGFGVVLGHDSIAQLAADIETARAAVKQSQAALSRAKNLAGGPGALGADAVENATKQTTADQAALTLAQRKLTATLGLKFPHQGTETDGAILTALANGTFKLARVTFPPGALTDATPHELRLLPLESGSAGTTGSGAATLWTASVVWDGPQDPTLPGRTLFGLLRTADIPEGARVQALAVGARGGLQGVLVPSSAVVASDGQYWCYVRKDTTSFTRAPIDIEHPLAQGYFVTADRVAPGEQIVTSSAGLLLAHQTNPSSASPD